MHPLAQTMIALRIPQIVNRPPWRNPRTGRRAALLRRARLQAGYSLVEVILAISVVAITVPVSLGLFVAGSSSTRESEADTRGTFLVRGVLQELELAQQGRSEVITNLSSWPEFPGGDQWLTLYANRQGEILGEASSDQYKEGVKLPNAAYLVALRGRPFEDLNNPLTPEDKVTNNLSKIEIRLESPAVANERVRRRSTFIRLMPGTLPADDSDEPE